MLNVQRDGVIAFVDFVFAKVAIAPLNRRPVFLRRPFAFVVGGELWAAIS
jgi:hypothetical protein